MVNITEDNLTIVAGCPPDTTVNTNVRLQGSVDYALKNTGDEDGYVSILVTLSDSAGNNTRFSQNLQAVPASGSFSDSHVLYLNAAYMSAGQITVTMQIQISGALTDTQSADCTFNVT